MKGKAIEKLCRTHLLPELPGYMVKGSLLAADRSRHLLRAFCFESSAFQADWSYVWCFVQPLFIPSAHVHFILGDRLGGGSHFWEITKDHEQEPMHAMLAAIKTVGVPYLEQFNTPEDIAARGEQQHANPQDPYLREAIAYSLVLSGRSAGEAVQELDRLLRILEKLMAEDEYDLYWPREMAARARHLKWTVEQSRDEAVRLLNMWRMQTLMNLGLEKHAAEVPDTYEGVLRMYRQENTTM